MKAAMALVPFLFVFTGAGAAQWQLDSRVSESQPRAFVLGPSRTPARGRRDAAR